MQKTQMEKGTEREKAALKALTVAEDLAEKKAKIYSRLLTDAALAEDMEQLAEHHKQRRKKLEGLICGKAKKEEDDQNGQGRDEVNEE